MAKNVNKVVVDGAVKLDLSMDSVTAKILPDPEVEFDTARIAGEIDALAQKHGGKDDLLRGAITQLLKGEMAQAREAAQASLSYAWKTLTRCVPGPNTPQPLCKIWPGLALTGMTKFIPRASAWIYMNRPLPDLQPKGWFILATAPAKSCAIWLPRRT